MKQIVSLFVVALCVGGCGGGGGVTVSTRLFANVDTTHIASNNAYYSTKVIDNGSYLGVTGTDAQAGWAISATVPVPTVLPATYSLPSNGTCVLQRIEGGATTATYQASAGTLTITRVDGTRCTGSLNCSTPGGTVTDATFDVDYLSSDAIEMPPDMPTWDDSSDDYPPPPPYFDPNAPDFPPAPPY